MVGAGSGRCHVPGRMVWPDPAPPSSKPGSGPTHQYGPKRAQVTIGAVTVVAGIAATVSGAVAAVACTVVPGLVVALAGMVVLVAGFELVGRCVDGPRPAEAEACFVGRVPLGGRRPAGRSPAEPPIRTEVGRLSISPFRSGPVTGRGRRR